MGIDITLYNLSDDELEDSARLTSVPGFFAMSEMFTALLNLMDEHGVAYDFDDPDLVPHLGAYRAFISKDRTAREARFADYCGTLTRSHALLEQEEGPLIDVTTGGAPIEPGPEEFAPDVRVFMAGVFLEPEPIPPQKTREFHGALKWVTAMFQRFVDHFEACDDPKMATRIGQLNEPLLTAMDFAERAIGEKCFLRLDF